MSTNHGIAQLHQEILGAASLVVTNPTWLELGTIGADLSLTVDRFAMPFPSNIWLVLEYLTAANPMETLSDAQGGSIPLTRPTILRPLQSGDRVLVALLHGGAQPVVVGRVVPQGTVTA